MKNVKYSAADAPVLILKMDRDDAASVINLWPKERETDYMARIASGDREAFGEIVQLYMLDLYKFACSILGDKTKAEDMTQEACLKLWTHAEKWSPEGRIKNWLFRITHNLCIDEIRSRKSHTPIDDVIFTLEDPGQDASQTYADTQMSRLVTKALFNLSERQRTALILVHYSGYSNIETAKIMDISIDATESLLVRGRQNLRRALSEHKKSIFD